MWRPIFIIALFVIALWREFNCVKIPQGEANKSANRWGNLRAKGGVLYHLQSYTCLALVHIMIKYTSSYGFAFYFLVVKNTRQSYHW
jgi:hypothetical protein